eukprot:TRINITY_DN50136_c0_g1_i2.p2 TRINITY_DN50136_c0_g1~~TRINITY_DN50136_c0_g1_i2.p2  ORF type:complete len:111 (+),score=30.81 TRINITY_DN50136_c0_g1_i2:64-396(+)
MRKKRQECVQKNYNPNFQRLKKKKITQDYLNKKAIEEASLLEKRRTDLKFSLIENENKLIEIQKKIFVKEQSLSDLESKIKNEVNHYKDCLLYTSPSPRDLSTSRMPSSA